MVSDQIGFTIGSNRFIMKNPEVEIWLPNKRVGAKVMDISDSAQRLRLVREVLIASGFAARLFGIDPIKIDDGELNKITSDYRLILFIGE